MPSKQPATPAAMTEQEKNELVRKLRPKLRMALSIAILGGVLVCVTIKDVVNGHFNEPWVTTTGKILGSSIVRVMRMQFPRKTACHPSFVYSFLVDGQMVQSKDESFDSDDDKKVSELVAQYPEGKDITVHYLKSYPGESYFDHPGSSSHSPIKLAICVSGFLLLFAAMQIMFSFRKITRVSETGKA